MTKRDMSRRSEEVTERRRMLQRGKKQKTKLNGEHLVFLSIATAVLSSPEVGVFSYCYYFYLGKLLINNLS